MANSADRTIDKSNKASVWRGFCDTLVHVLLFLFYLIYFIFKGRENRASTDPTNCLINKPSLQPIPPSANVCCIHGVQTRSTYGDSAAEPKVEERRIDSVIAVPPSLAPPPQPPGASGSRRIDYSDKIIFSKHFSSRGNGNESSNLNGLTISSKPVAIRIGLLSRLTTWLRGPGNFIYSFFRARGKEPKGEKKDKAPKTPTANNVNGIALSSPAVSPPVPQWYQPNQGKKIEANDAPRYPQALLSDKTHPHTLADSCAEVAEDKTFAHEWNESEMARPPPPQPPPPPPATARKHADVDSLEGKIRLMDGKMGHSVATIKQTKWHDFHQLPAKAEIRVTSSYEDGDRRTIRVPKQDKEAHFPTVAPPPAAPLPPLVSRGSTILNAASEKKKLEDQMVDRKAHSKGIFDEEILPWGAREEMGSPQREHWPYSEHTSPPNIGIGRSYKKYTRYYFKTSSYRENIEPVVEQGAHLPRHFCNPQGAVHDVQDLTKEYGNHLMTNIGSPEKCREVSRVLSSPEDAEKGVELFRRQRQRMEGFVVNEARPTRFSSVLPPSSGIAPPNVDNLLESVRQAADRHYQWDFSEFKDTDSLPPVPPRHSEHSSLVHDVKAPVQGHRTQRPWSHERLFSPVPFGRHARASVEPNWLR